LRDVVFALLLFEVVKKRTTIRSMQSLPPPRTLHWRRACDEERHARKKKEQGKKEEIGEKDVSKGESENERVR